MSYYPCKTDEELKPRKVRRKDGSFLWVTGGGRSCSPIQWSNEKLINKRVNDAKTRSKVEKIDLPRLVVPDLVGLKVITVTDLYQIRYRTKLKVISEGLLRILDRTKEINHLIVKQLPEAGKIVKQNEKVHIWTKAIGKVKPGTLDPISRSNLQLEISAPTKSISIGKPIL